MLLTAACGRFLPVGVAPQGGERRAEGHTSIIAAPTGMAFNNNLQHTDSLGYSLDVPTRCRLARNDRWKTTQGAGHRWVVRPSRRRRLAKGSSSTRQG